MNKIVFVLITLTYASMTIMSVITNINKRRETIFQSTNIIEIVGSILIVLSNLECFYSRNTHLIYLLLGLLLIWIATLMKSSYKFEKVNNIGLLMNGILFILVLFLFFRIKN
ncbi:hypothetical protein [Anaeromicropila herbilytica]|uniref:Uncharacterized protein n=1 Tax=Anaeromicropila herbilytica TaxID=2785025 RepID=A0A7R7EQK7_9FIRM|nr:hypothetical protein [Anaeromicropila herbilytica]BCN32956.1 hypothetical protein bsdtb5_42510 [Anaeromicropila herbilytica]